VDRAGKTILQLIELTRLVVLLRQLATSRLIRLTRLAVQVDQANQVVLQVD
ncbi:hypothetical protein ACH5RR_040911, partial [Cinchona calisaya]